MSETRAKGYKNNGRAEACRKRRHDLAIQLRKNKRAEAIRNRRATSEAVRGERLSARWYEVPPVAEVPPDAIDGILQRFSAALSSSKPDVPPDEFVLEDSGQWVTVILSTSNDPGHPSYKNALWTLSNMCALDGPFAMALCDRGAMMVFTQALAHPLVSIQELGLYGIGNIYGEEDIHLVLPAIESSLEAVLGIFMHARSIEIVDLCAFCLNNVFYKKKDGAHGIYVPMGILEPLARSMFGHLDQVLFPWAIRLLAMGTREERKCAESAVMYVLEAMQKFVNMYLDSTEGDGLSECLTFLAPVLRQWENISFWCSDVEGDHQPYDIVRPLVKCVTSIFDKEPVPCIPMDLRCVDAYPTLAAKVNVSRGLATPTEYLVLQHGFLDGMEYLLTMISESSGYFVRATVIDVVRCMGNILVDSTSMIQLGITKGLYALLAQIHKRYAHTSRAIAKECLMAVLQSASVPMDASLKESLLRHIASLGMIPAACDELVLHHKHEVESIAFSTYFLYEIAWMDEKYREIIYAHEGIEEALSDVSGCQDAEKLLELIGESEEDVFF